MCFIATQHATGVDLKMPERGKRTKRKRENDLTDINAFKNTPYYRLSKKIFKSTYNDYDFMKLCNSNI